MFDRFCFDMNFVCLNVHEFTGFFLEVFHGFDPIATSKLNDKKISAPGYPATSLLSEVKLCRTENARQVCKVRGSIPSVWEQIIDLSLSLVVQLQLVLVVPSKSYALKSNSNKAFFGSPGYKF